MANNEGNLLVTGKWGEPHVTSSQTRNFNSGLVGPECYVFDGLTCTMTNSNTAHIDPGVACFNGSDVEVPPGGIDVPINNGTQGNKQNVVICFAYQKDANDQTEKVTAVALYGDPDPVSPQDPTIPEGKITDGGNGPYYMPLWRIVLDNVSVGDPEKLFIKIQSNAEFQSSIVPTSYSLNNGATLDVVGKIGIIVLSRTITGTIQPWQEILSCTLPDGISAKRATVNSLTLDGLGNAPIAIAINGKTITVANRSSSSYKTGDVGQLLRGELVFALS